MDRDGQYTETFNVLKLLKGYRTTWEVSNILKLYSVEVCFYQTCKWFVFALHFYLR